MKRWEENVATVIAYILALALGMSITIGGYYIVMLLVKKVFF